MNEGNIQGLPEITALIKLLEKIAVTLPPENTLIYTNEASLPADPIKPKKKLVFVIGFLLSLLTSLIFAYMRVLIKNHFATRD